MQHAAVFQDGSRTFSAFFPARLGLATCSETCSATATAHATQLHPPSLLPALQAKTGSGLPAGPAGLLGAVEGFSYLSLLAGLVVFGLQVAEKGSLPGMFG